MPEKKVDSRGLIEDLLNEVIAIDADTELTRGRKTQAIARAATKFKNRLHDSQRKKDAQRIALTTYNKYLTNARREVTKRNWKHHSLPDQIETLCKKHPEHAGRIRAWLDMDIEEMRFSHRDFLREITNKDKAGTGKANELYSDIRTMKLDHEVMLHLTKNEIQKAVFSKEQLAALDKKKENNARVLLDYNRYISLLVDLLTRPTDATQNDPKFAYSLLALGLAGATGRRLIEVVYQGQFEKIDKHRLRFTGQAKKRGGTDPSDVYEIYTLVDADIVLRALDIMRNLPEGKALHDFDNLPEAERNTQISWRVHASLNRAANRELPAVCSVEKNPADSDEEYTAKRKREFKDTRTIYARIAYDLFYKTDKRWKGKDEDIFWRDLLGHEGLKTLQNYKQFEVHYPPITEPKPAETKPEKLSRIDALKALDAEVEKRKAFGKMHEWAKEQVTANPSAIITKSQLIRLKVYRPTIEDYMALAGDLLSTPEKVDATALAVKPKRMATSKAAEPANAKSNAGDRPEKPRLSTAPHGEGEWVGVVSLGGKEVVRVTGHISQMAAYEAAYAAYMATIKS